MLVVGFIIAILSASCQISELGLALDHSDVQYQLSSDIGKIRPLNEGEQKILYKICSAFRSKRTTFPFKYQHKEFQLALAERDCEGRISEQELEMTLNVVLGSRAETGTLILQNTQKPAYTGKYQAILNTRIDETDQICQAVLQSREVTNDRTLGKDDYLYPGTTKNLFQVHSESFGRSSIVLIDSIDGIFVTKIEKWSVLTDPQDPYYGLIEVREEEQICQGQKSGNYRFTQRFKGL